MAGKDQVEKTVYRLTEEIAHACGVSLYDVVFRRSGPRWKLQVFLARDGAQVSLEDCERVSRQLSRELDVHDPIPAPYDLEVSSPGIERPLRRAAHFDSVVGSRVRIKWRSSEGAASVAVGELTGFEDGVARLREADGTEHEVPLESVLNAKVHVEW